MTMIPLPAKKIHLIVLLPALVAGASGAAFGAASAFTCDPRGGARGAPLGAARRYLDQLDSSSVQLHPAPSSTMGVQVAESLLHSTISDPCAFDAASRSIQSAIAQHGSVTSSDISRIIARSDSVASLVRHHFPGAVGSSLVIPRVRSVLNSFGCDATNTLLTQSVCPDEINHEPGDITDLFIKKYGGKVFHLGGLAGIPFTGRTVFAAFAAHVPDGGHAFVLHAPHVGMSDDFELGKYSREGQAQSGPACGAAVGAMCHCSSGLPPPDLAGASDDYQMNYIIREIGRCMHVIDSEPDENSRQAELARQSHRIGKAMLDEIVSTDFGCNESMLFVLSGIQINMPFEFEDYFQPLNFEVRRKDGSVTDLLVQTFGMP